MSARGWYRVAIALSYVADGLDAVTRRIDRVLEESVDPRWIDTSVASRVRAIRARR